MNFTELNEKLEKILKKYQDKKNEEAIKDLMQLADSNEISPENIDEYTVDWRRYNDVLKTVEKTIDKTISEGNIHETYETLYLYNLAKSNLNQLTQAVVQIKQELVKKAQMIRTDIEKAKKLEEMKEREEIAQKKKQ